MKCFDRRLAVFFASFLAMHSVSAMEMGRCPGIGEDLEDKLWGARANVLGARADLVIEEMKPSAWNTLLADRFSFEVSYGNEGTWTLQEGSRSYNFNRGNAKASYSFKYTLPFSVFAKPSKDAVRAKKDLQDFDLNEQRVEFYDLLYDLRLALAAKRAVEKSEDKGLEDVAAAEIKISKLAARVMNMTNNKITFEPECIQ